VPGAPLAVAQRHSVDQLEDIKMRDHSQALVWCVLQPGRQADRQVVAHFGGLATGMSHGATVACKKALLLCVCSDHPGRHTLPI